VVGSAMPPRYPHLRAAARRLPLPVAAPLDRLGRGGDVRELFFAVEAFLRTTAVIVKAAYLTAESPPDARLNAALRRNLVMPSMGSWGRFLVAAADVLDDHAVGGRVPGLPALARRLVQDDVGEVIHLRNVVHGHAGAAPSPEIAELVLARGLPVLEDLIEAAAPLREHALVVFREATGTWFRAMGPEPSLDDVVRRSAPALAAPAALVELPGEPLPLFPLVLGTYEGFEPVLSEMAPGPVLVFDGVDIDRRRLLHLGRAGRGHGRAWFDHYRRLVEARRLPLVPLRPDEIEPDALLERSHRALDEVLEAMRDDRIGPRPDQLRLEPRAARLLDAACDGQARLAVLTGEAGVGKSEHLRSLALRARQRGHGVIFVRAVVSLAESERSLKQLLRSVVERQLGIVERAASTLARLAAGLPEGKHVVLLLDGLDELGASPLLRRRLDELLGWIKKVGTTVPPLRVVLSMRSHAWAELDQDPKRGNPLLRPSADLFRPTHKAPGAPEHIGHTIELQPLSQAVVGEQYELLRHGLPGHQPTTPFERLGPGSVRACRTPRLMMRLLKRYHGVRVPHAVAAWDLWLAVIDAQAYRLPGFWGQAAVRRGDRVALLDAFVGAQLEQQTPEPSLEALRLQPPCRLLVQTGREWDVAAELQSEGLIMVRGDPSDPLGRPLVRAADPELNVALHVRGSLRGKQRLCELMDLLSPLEGTPLHPVLRDAVVVSAIVREELREQLSSPTSLPVPLLARAVVGLLQRQAPDEAVRALGAAPREGLLEQVLAVCRAEGCLDLLEPVARSCMLRADTVAAVELVAVCLRHVEAIDDATAWLTEVATQGGRLGAMASLHLAEILRDKGQWRRAVRAYGRVLEGEELQPAERALAQAARGESWIWLGQAQPALEDLDAALETLPHGAPEQLCRILTKRGIALRLMETPVAAAAALARARELARTHGMITEQARVELELGLVAGLLGGHEEAQRRIEAAGAMHRAEGYIKGQKKAAYCLGWLAERRGDREAALRAYRSSLALNEEHFDLLGLALNHTALARLEHSERASYHRDRAERYQRRLQHEDRTDAPELQPMPALP
jgi:tetratricopeptide (TPR) repeat protein